MNFANVTDIRIPQGEVIQIQDSLSRVLWKKKSIDYTEPFYVEDVSGYDNTLSIVKAPPVMPITVEKSLDGENWETIGMTSTTPITATIPANSKLYLRCDTDSWDDNRINTSGNCNVGGNIMSLLYGSTFTGNETSFPSGSQYNFYDLFNGNTKVIDASKLILPATTLSYYCYAYMFDGCTSLTAAPALQAMSLAESCYIRMFAGCTSLTTAPELPATTLTRYCYQAMFVNCTSLQKSPYLPATNIPSDAYVSMFNGCTNLSEIKCNATNGGSNSTTKYWVGGVAPSGIFYKNTNASWVTGSSDDKGAPSGWTVVDL